MGGGGEEALREGRDCWEGGRLVGRGLGQSAPVGRRWSWREVTSPRVCPPHFPDSPI